MAGSGLVVYIRKISGVTNVVTGKQLRENCKCNAVPELLVKIVRKA